MKEVESYSVDLKIGRKRDEIAKLQSLCLAVLAEEMAAASLISLRKQETSAVYY